MLNIALFGPPGAGKGTQSQWLIPHYEFVHISPGDILRENVRQKTSLGEKVQFYINNGVLVPDELVIQAVTHQIDTHKEAKGFLFDGYPRTLRQAAALDDQLAVQERRLDLVLFLEVAAKESYKRIRHRGTIEGRADDQSDEKIATRFEYYQDATLPIAEYYQAEKKLIHIPGEFDIVEVQRRIKEEVERYLDQNITLASTP